MMDGHPKESGNTSVSGAGGTIQASSEDTLKFYIFGNDIAHSLSPQMHNSGFGKIGYPGYYAIHETPAVDQSIAKLMSQPNFGGASVTFPHKLQIGKLLDVITPRATRVGAVNTVVVRHSNSGRILEGDNTDWSGIRACLLKSRISNLESSSAVVLGAGGAARAACYALETLHVKDVIIVNRGLSRANKMAAHFPKLRTRICTDLKEAHGAASAPIRVIVGCVPADELTEDKIPTSWFTEADSGVLVEMAYRPVETGIMKMAARYSGWHIFRGLDVLKEQAYAQFELWTGQEAPIKEMVHGMEAELYRRRVGKSTESNI